MGVADQGHKSGARCVADWQCDVPGQRIYQFAPLVQGKISGAGEYYSRFHDEQHYRGRGVYIARIYGLDTATMLRQIQAEVDRPPAYGPMNECATTVRRFLKLGGGDQFASWWSRNNVPPITPDDVEDYASSIVSNTKANGSYQTSIKGEGSWQFWKYTN